MTEQGCHVLVVDDEEGIRDTLREVVEMGGGSAVLAANGEEALRLMTEQRPCLVIIDLLMPVLSGAELVATMRSRPELSDIPFIISTSAPGRAPRGVPVLAKPVDIAAVWGWMRRSCDCVQTSGHRG
jgi:CheY-like chemotaxis protein